MKTKILYTIILVLSILSLSTNAQATQKKLRKTESFKANCLSALQNGNRGVVESAIFVSVQFKNRFPNENISTLIEALEEIANEDESPRVSYKAQLAKTYINNTEWFENIDVSSIEYEKEVYAEIAETFSSKILAKEL